MPACVRACVRACVACVSVCASVLVRKKEREIEDFFQPEVINPLTPFHRNANA